MVAANFEKDGGKVPKTDADAAKTDDMEYAYRLLGGRKVFGHQMRSSLDAHDLIVQGLSVQAVIHLVDRVSVLSAGDALNTAIGVSLPTLQRKTSRKGRDRLSVEQSSRTWRFAKTLARATDVLGDQKAAEAWLLAPAIGLDNRRPIDLLSSDPGAGAVEDYLARMEYGVYS